MKIITISREFGSGGREIGKRLANQMNFAYYDKEILIELAKKSGLDEKYLEQTFNNNISQYYPIRYGRTFSTYTILHKQLDKTDLLLKQQQILKNFASKENCIVVGRGSNVILNQYHPFNIFVYANMPSKISRCRKYEKESTTDTELEKKIKQIDKYRKQYYLSWTGMQWCAKEHYNLCINTTDINIKKIIPVLSEYILNYFMEE